MRDLNLSLSTGTSTAEWFHQRVAGLDAASNSSSSDRRKRKRMQELDALIQSKVQSSHPHYAAAGLAALLEIPVDDNRMAAVLGHEIAHCILRHPQEQMGDSLIGELMRCAARVSSLDSADSLSASPFCPSCSLFCFTRVMCGPPCWSNFSATKCPTKLPKCSSAYRTRGRTSTPPHAPSEPN